MCLTEFDEEVYNRILREDSYEEGLNEGISLGKSEGLAEGETLLARLVARLVSDNRFDDLKNLEQRKETLYAEYGIK